jgi:SAM-dependent methyltransferase
MKGHYFNQDLHVAKLIYGANSTKHVDIGSRTDGFVAHLVVFREVEVFDIRDIKSTVEKISFTWADLSSSSFNHIEYTDSFSCLHAIEHFGLARYGDTIDPEGQILALENMWRTLKVGGKFYFSTPIGPQRIKVNAYRVFSVRYLFELFESKYDIVSFSYINDKGDLVVNQDLNNPEFVSENFGCIYGCGIFEMIKK